METHPKTLLLNLAEKTKLLKYNLDNFQKVQEKFINDIDKMYKESVGNNESLSIACEECVSVLMKVAYIMNHLNMLLEFELPTVPINIHKLTNSSAAQHQNPTTHVLQSKFLMYSITYVQDPDKLLFYAWDNKNPQMVELLKLRSTNAGLTAYTEFPDDTEVFGLCLDNDLFRAKFLDSSKRKEAILIDLGEKINVNKLQITQFYKLPKKLQEIPEQAILCKLIGVVDRKYSIKELKNLLNELLYERTAFVVEGIENGVLEVLMVEKVTETVNEKKFSTISNEEPLDHSVAQAESVDNSDLNDLYEVPFSTTNALKAVFGFIPTDERRLCQFYDPQTGGCFKGARCKLEHAPRSKDAFTSDVVPASAYNYEHAEIIYEEQQIINITVTHVDKLFGFYAQVNEKLNENSDMFVWEDVHISNKQHFKKTGQIPRVYDMVLARTAFGLWYRAQIRNELQTGRVFEVFFLDYGNTSVVELKNLAPCPQSALLQPFKAQVLLLANVKACHVVSTAYVKGIEMLNKALLNETFDVRVVSHELDLFIIEFIDDDKKAVIAKLCAEGLLKPTHY